MSSSERQDLMVRAAWLYHIEELTQAEVAARLGLTRRSVNEMLGAAMSEGVVTVTFNTPLQECVALEQALCEKFGLEDAVVVLTPADPDQLHRVIGRATGAYLGRRLPAFPAEAIGVGWGQTLRQTIRFMPPQAMPGLTVKSVIGGLTRGTEINTFETVHAFAEKLGAQCRYFTAPVYADTPQSREVILAQPVFRELYEESTRIDMAILSCGDSSDEARLVRHAMAHGTGAQLRAAGAVGDLICRFIDADGRLVDHPLNLQVLAPELEALYSVPTRLVASGGSHKHAVMRAVARGGYATIIVTDTDCARAMLADD